MVARTPLPADMPLDPFFTSAQKDESIEARQRRTAVAKAIQFKINTSCLNSEKRKKALRHATLGPNNAMCRKLKGMGPPLITGDQQHRSLTGFKPPHKVWDTPKNEDHQ